jgi:hypothetical protein
MHPKRLLTPCALFFLVSLQPAAYAADAGPSYRDLKDASTISVDWSAADTQAVTLGGNRTLTFSNGQKGGKYILVLRQDVTGSRTVAWPSSVHWAGVSGPTLTTIAGKADYIGFIFNGTSYDMVWMSQGL